MIALSMDKDKDHYIITKTMSDEFCFFDGKQKRCKRLVTLTAKCLPSFAKQAGSSCHNGDRGREQSLFTKMLKQVSVNPSVMFNPVGWCTDMA